MKPEPVSAGSSRGRWRFLRLYLLTLATAICPLGIAADICSYSSYQWNTWEQRAENFQQISKPYSELLSEEIDADSGCSVCREDQRWLRLPGVEPALVCKHFVEPYRQVLELALADGFVIDSLVGYRVGKTRGDPDQYGRRSGFSNHSFGIALDINSASNGLYNNCLGFNRDCRLSRGGPWQPQQDPKSIAPDSLLVRAMKRAGLRWGGEIQGRQKDFMHFSPSGY